MMKRKIATPIKHTGKPIARRLLPKMQIAVDAIVEGNMSRSEAAKIAGMTDDAVRKGIRDNPLVQEYYAAKVTQLITFAKAKAVHALLREIDGPNANARVAAARAILEYKTQTTAAGGAPAVPGFAILISDARSSAPAIDVTPLPGLTLAPGSQED